MNRIKRGHMSKESLTLNMPLLHLLSSQPVVGSVRKLPPSYKRLASLLADQWDQPYSTTMNWLRCTLSFCLLRSSIQCIRGARSSIGRFAQVVSPVDLVTAETFSLIKFLSRYFPPLLLHYTIPSNSFGYFVLYVYIFITDGVPAWA